MATEEVKFLRDQVQQLNAILSQYQEKYPPLGLTKPSPRETIDAPWLLDNNLMSPLLAEYQSQMNLMKEQLEIYQTMLTEARSQINQVISENKGLTQQLKSAMESHLANIGGGGQEEVEADDLVTNNLQQQLQMALQEKDAALEMWHRAEMEVERVQNLAQNQNSFAKVQSVELQKAEFLDTISELNEQIESLQDDVRKERKDRMMALNQAAELRRTLERVQIEMRKQAHYRSEVNASKDSATSQVKTVQRQVAELQNSDDDEMEDRIEEAGFINENLLKEKKSVEDKLLEAQKRLADNERKDYETLLQMRESVQMVESAMLEKDQALHKEQQNAEEIERLRSAISNLLDEAGARTRKEVDEVKKQCNQNISRLMEEIHSLEMESSERQAQCERAIREKRAAESELEHLYQEGLKSGVKDTAAYDDLNRRACNAERTRDEALVKLDAATAEMRRQELTLKQEKKHLSTEVEQLKDRLILINQEFEDSNSSRVKLCEQVDELKKIASQAKQERDAAQRNFTKEMSCMSQTLAQKDKEYEVKLQALEDGHRKTSGELRTMLNQQQRMSAKWKEECRSTASRMESQINDMRADISREKKRNSELTKLLKDSKDRTVEAEEMLNEYSRNLKSMENRIRDSEQRSAMRVPISKHVNLDRDIVSERKKIQRELERSLRESEVSLHSGSMAAPLAVADLANSSSLKRDTDRLTS